MSDYSRRRLAGRHVSEPAVHKEKKTHGLEKRERHGEDKCDNQQSDVSSLSQSSYNYNSFDESQHVSVVKRPADVECINLDADTVSISSNESDCDNMEVGACISENVSTTQCDSKDKNQSQFLSSDLTEEAGISNKPKLSLSPTVSSSTSKFVNSRICVETTAKVYFIKNLQGADRLQVYLGEATLSPSNKTRKVLATQTLSTLSPSTVPPNNQAKHDPEENIEHEVSKRDFCCTPCWLTYIYGKPSQCEFAAETTKAGRGYVAGSSSPVKLESCQDEVCLIEDLNNSVNTVQKGSTSAPKLRLPCKKRRESNDNSEEPFQNKQKIPTYLLGKRSGVRRRKSQGENSYLKGKQESILTSVLELKTLRTHNKSSANSRKKAQPSDIQLYKGKEDMKIVSMDSDIVSISSSESDIIEAEVSSLENVRKALPRQNISQELKHLSPLSKIRNRKICYDANISEADQNKNKRNTEYWKVNSMATVETSSHETRKVLDVAQDLRTSLKNDGEKNSVQSEVNKFARSERGSSHVHPKRILIRESVVRKKGSFSVRFQDTGPEPSKKNGQLMFQVRDNIHNDYQAATYMDEQYTQLEEQNTLHPESKCDSNHDNLLNGSGEARWVHGNSISVAHNKMFSEVLNKDLLATRIEGVPRQSPASSDLNTEQHSQRSPLGDQEYQFSWTDQLSEIITHFPLGMQEMNTGRSSEDKQTAVIHRKDCSKGGIGRCLDNLEDMTKQFDEEYKSLPCISRSKNALHNAISLDNLSDGKTAEKVQTDTCSKKFSAFVCGEQSKCSCKCVPNATSKPTMKNTQPGRPEPTYETRETFASPKLDMNKSDIDNKKGKKPSTKYADNSQLRLKKAEQIPLTQLCKNLFVKKIKKTITSKLTKDSGIDFWSKTESSGLFKDGSSSFKSDSIGSSLSKQDFKAPGQMSKEGWTMHPEKNHNLPNGRTRPKNQKRSSAPRHTSLGVHPAISNRSRELDFSEQTFSSEKASERFPSPAADKNDALMHNLEVHIRLVKENQLLKNFQNAQMSTKKSVTTIDSRKTFPYLATNTGSQLRKLEGEQELPKYNYTLVNKVKENTSSVVKRKSTDFPLLPAAQKLTEETERGIDPDVKHDATKKPKKQAQNQKHCTLTEDRKTGSALSRKAHSPGLDQNISCVETTDVPPPVKCRLKSSTIWDKRKVRSKKAKNPRSKRSSSKRRKSGLSSQNAAENQRTCTKECRLGEQTAGGLGGAVKSFKGNVSVGKDVIEAVVSKCTDQPPKENSQKLSYLKNKPNLKYDLKNPSREQQMEANVFSGKMASCSYTYENSRSLHVPSCDVIKATISSSLSTNKVEVEQNTTYIVQCNLDKVSLPVSDTEVKTADATCGGRPIEETTPKEKTYVRQCVVKLCRLPLALERQFL